MEQSRDPSDAPSKRSLAVLAGLIVVALVSALAFNRLEENFLQQDARRDAATLQLAVDGLTGTIDRFRPLPALIAERPILTQALKDPENEGILPYANEQLRQTAFRIGASDVYLMDISGNTIAASSYRKENSFIGRNFGYRPYFQQALDGGTGQFSALGTTSGERGYFIAAPVIDNLRTLGVVAVKFTVDAFEAAWDRGPSDIIVTDIYDIIFMSNRADWHFRSLAPLTNAATSWIEETRQYPLDRVLPLDSASGALEDGTSFIEIGDTPSTRTRYLRQTIRIPEAGWDVSILTPVAPARTQALWVLAGLASLLVLLGLITTVVLQRRAQLRERLAAQAVAQEMAEVQVAKRTAELNAANARLRDEVEERRSTEDRLRKTQADLVQAGKLAALGQMSAALSHELNQPLAAVKSYADNALAYLSRGRESEARDNVSRISDMADRMATISKLLRNFARRPQDKPAPTAVVQVVDDAVALLSARIRADGAEVRVHRPDTELWAIAGTVRLQQVVVNLITNALDAMKDHPAPLIEISIASSEQGIVISVHDRGPGIPEDRLPQIFDPFFTTKPHGSGLGLGLSISYNIVRDFGGRLSAHNHADGGAVFEITLKHSDRPGKLAAE